MNVIWDSNTLKKIANADFNIKWEATGLEIDSRNVKKGDLFCAIKGKNFDGHDFISGAIKNGASACLISKESHQVLNVAYSKVRNVPEALVAMARDARKRSNAKFIAITGSVGKTGTKEIFKTGLSKVTNVFVNERSFNNHLGVPLSLSRIPYSAKFCVLEIGMNKRGEINKLSKLVKPELAVITAVEKSHLQGLKNLKNIAIAKSEILDFIPKEGCIVFNKDTNFSELINDKANRLSIKNRISYGKESTANIKLINYKFNNNYYVIHAECFGKKILWKMPAIGEHWILNSLALIGTSVHFGLDLDKILEGLSLFNLPSGRGNKIKLKYNKRNFLLIDDSYNSNPASLSASLKNLEKINNKGKKIIVLGDMMELGKNSIKLHKNFKQEIENKKIEIIFTTGSHMYQLHKVIREGIKKIHEENLNELFGNLKNFIEKDDVVLVKGSNSMNLRTIVNKIIEQCDII